MWIGPGLWLRLVGRLTLYRDGGAVPAPEVGSRKARTLLALLAVGGGRVVAVDEAADAVWEIPPERPAEGVSTLVSRLRVTLGPAAIAGDRACGYRLGQALRGDEHVDVHVAAGLAAQAETALAAGRCARAVAPARRALELLDDSLVLADQPDAVWVRAARTRHAHLLRRARHVHARATLCAGDPATAAATAQAAIHADPLDEAAYRTLMRAYHTIGEPARALIAYQELRGILAAELGVHPSLGTRHLHTSILRGLRAM